MKKNKIKSDVVFTSSSDRPFLHVMVLYKNKYIDILGVHSHKLVCLNHEILYNVDRSDIYFTKYKPRDFERKMEWYHKNENPNDWKYAERYASIIFNSHQFRSLIDS